MGVFDSMIVHIQDANSPKQACETLVKITSRNQPKCNHSIYDYM